MEKSYAVITSEIALICDKCSREIDSTNTSATIVDGKKAIPTKCENCGDETIQPRRYPAREFKREQ